MNWDFFAHSWLPDMLKPVMCLAFFMLFAGLTYLWLKFMAWTIK